MHEIQLTPRLVTPGQPGLVCGCDEDKAGSLQLLQMRGRLLADVKLVERQGANLMLTFNPDLVEYAISFDKDA